MESCWHKQNRNETKYRKTVVLKEREVKTVPQLHAHTQSCTIFFKKRVRHIKHHHKLLLNPVPPHRPRQIVSRYDIIVILEVVDISGQSVRIFLDALNKWVFSDLDADGKRHRDVTSSPVCPVGLWRFDTNHHYTLKISSRLGRNAYKEQYMFLYRWASTCTRNDSHWELFSTWNCFTRITDGQITVQWQYMIMYLMF